ncbi:YceD family protein [Caulobacter segnis]|uniref:DUF177 domain-containing protein n=1 Tax=Caulobacter segnis TaxID=88688 RepID=UPI0024102361|nr:YceD family protein [Caulobacter segnis]MDG2521939.1 YceD family protein [Caulobacter segnis]
MTAVWPKTVTLGEVSRGPVSLELAADEASRKKIAKSLGLEAVGKLEAKVKLTAWLDGAEMKGRLKADVVQTCGVSAESLPAKIDAEFMVRLLPPGSPNAPSDDSPEIDIEHDAEDQPDVLETETVDVSGYVVEHLSLELDPFPRKPGAEFVQPPEPVDLSPFAALKSLQKPKADE